jgi:putative addiction module component (TIGR02574 family)
MARSAGHLLEQALRLSEAERAELAARLIESLDPDTDEDADPAWSAEIGQRLDDLDQGGVHTIPWPDAPRMILEDRDESNPG